MTLDGKLEPEANLPMQDTLTCATVSLAISMKRIADAFDGTTMGVDISDALAGLTLQYTRRN